MNTYHVRGQRKKVRRLFLKLAREREPEAEIIPSHIPPTWRSDGRRWTWRTTAFAQSTQRRCPAASRCFEVTWVVKEAQKRRPGSGADPGLIRRKCLFLPNLECLRAEDAFQRATYLERPCCAKRVLINFLWWTDLAVASKSIGDMEKEYLPIYWKNFGEKSRDQQDAIILFHREIFPSPTGNA